MREKCVEPRNRYLPKNYYIVRNRNLCVRYFKKKFFLFLKHFLSHLIQNLISNRTKNNYENRTSTLRVKLSRVKLEL